MGRQGYMSMDMYGYALARSRSKPSWASYLRPDVRLVLKKGIRFIQGTSECLDKFPDEEAT